MWSVPQNWLCSTGSLAVPVQLQPLEQAFIYCVFVNKHRVSSFLGPHRRKVRGVTCLLFFNLEGNTSQYFLYCVMGWYLSFKDTCFVCNYIQQGTHRTHRRKEIKVQWYFAAMKNQIIF